MPVLPFIARLLKKDRNPCGHISRTSIMGIRTHFAGSRVFGVYVGGSRRSWLRIRGTRHKAQRVHNIPRIIDYSSLRGAPVHALPHYITVTNNKPPSLPWVESILCLQTCFKIDSRSLFVLPYCVYTMSNLGTTLVFFFFFFFFWGLFLK